MLTIAGSVVVGRDEALADVTVGDNEMSRRHARITASNGALVIEDLKSTNGTHVNGEAITVPRELAVGDRIRLGATLLECLRAPQPVRALPSSAQHAGIAELRVLSGSAVGEVIPLSGPIVAGRDPSCDVVFTDDEVSRRHAQIVLEDGLPVVEDLGSTNGTFVDGERVTGRQRLEPGGLLELGGAVLQFASPVVAQTRVRNVAPAVTRVRDVVAQPSRLLAADAGSRKWWTLLAVCLGMFILLVDISVVNVAIPTMAPALNASFSSLVWVVNAYVLGLAALILPFGRIGDIAGQRNVFALGVVIFTSASLACGLADSSSLLIAGRAVQGVGGGMMFATSLALLSQEFSYGDRAIGFAVWGAVSGGAVAMGPVLGGVLTDGFGWEAIFLFNVPVGILTTIVLLTKTLNLRPADADPLDVPGMVILVPALFLLTLALATGYSDGWGATHIVVEFAASTVLLAAFVAVELRRSKPMLDLKLFTDRSFTGTAVAAFAMSGSVFALLIYITIYVQTILGLSALATGLAFLPMMVLAFLVAAPAGRLTSRLPTRWFMGIGLVLIGVGLLLCRGFGDGLVAGSEWSHLVLGFVVSGVGIGFITPAMASAATAIVGPTRAGMASGAFITSRQLGTALGVASIGAVFQHVVAAKAPSAMAGVGGGVSESGFADSIVNGYADQFVLRSPSSVRTALDQAARTVGGETMNELFVIGGIVALVGAALSFVLIRRDAFAVMGKPGEAP